MPLYTLYEVFNKFNWHLLLVFSIKTIGYVGDLLLARLRGINL